MKKTRDYVNSTNPAKQARVEAGLDFLIRLAALEERIKLRIANLRSRVIRRNLQLEMEIRLENTTGKVADIGGQRVTRGMLRRRNPEPAPKTWATG